MPHLLAFIGLGRRSETGKDLEILILRHQLNSAVRKQTKTIKPTRTEKLILALQHDRTRVFSTRQTPQSPAPTSKDRSGS